MYVRVNKSKNHQYVTIMKNYREDGKTKQKVVASLGRLDDLSVNEAENIASKLVAIVKSKKRLVQKEKVEEIEELDRLNYGYIAYKKIWNRFKFDEILDELVEDKNIEYEFKEIVFSLVIDRLLNPKSKLALFNNKDDYFYINNDLKLQNIYRSLDILAENKELIEKKLFMQNKNLFNISTDIVFYDLTTFYYESKNENDLKKFGYSKDGKFGDVQVVMGLLIDKEGMPIGYELFSGNTFEGKTVVDILNKLKVKFSIDKVVIVADRGLNSKMNLKYIKDAGYDYLMASKIKSMGAKVKEKILNINGYKTITADEEDYYSYKVIDYENKVKYKENDSNKEITLKEQLVCTYSTKRAKKDKKDRDRALEKANKLISENQKSSMTNTRNFKKFVAIKNEECKEFIMSMDWLKTKEQRKYDGFYAITTSKLDLDPMEVIDNYHNLYKIEDSFRVLKSTFNTRPIFHHKQSRIEGHFIMSFIAFMLERDLEIRLKKSKLFKDETITPNRIREALNSLEVSKVNVNEQILYLKGNHSNGVDKLKLGRKIHKFLTIKQLNNLSSDEDIMKILN